MTKPEDNRIIYWTRMSIKKDNDYLQSLITRGIDPSSTELVFDVNNYYDGLERANKISNSVFMPPELQNSFEPIRPHIFWQVDSSKTTLKLKVTFSGKLKSEKNEEWRIERFKTFADYFNSIQKTIIDLESWLDKNSNSPSKLNL